MADLWRWQTTSIVNVGRERPTDREGIMLGQAQVKRGVVKGKINKSGKCPISDLENLAKFETVAGILDSIWTGQVIAFILPLLTFFSKGANYVRTG